MRPLMRATAAFTRQGPCKSNPSLYITFPAASFGLVCVPTFMKTVCRAVASLITMSKRLSPSQSITVGQTYPYLDSAGPSKAWYPGWTWISTPLAVRATPGRNLGLTFVPTLRKKRMRPSALPTMRSVRPSPSQSAALGAGCEPPYKAAPSSPTCRAFWNTGTPPVSIECDQNEYIYSGPSPPTRRWWPLCSSVGYTIGAAFGDGCRRT
mmetsp:Transcript_34830/g.48304  ORF Transcript_34830/g.48304 Transcript_34830/m.48304 type:complete len:209 (+) Transcript_34830:1241-1867(+)